MSTVIVSNLVSFVGVGFLPESPRLLMSLGRKEEANQSFEQISRWNGTEVSFSLMEKNSSLNQPLIESSDDISIRDPSLDSKQAIKLALGRFDVKVNLVVMTIF